MSEGIYIGSIIDLCDLFIEYCGLDISIFSDMSEGIYDLLLCEIKPAALDLPVTVKI